MDEDLLISWYRFLDGKWTTKMPKLPGQYCVAARDGHVARQPLTVYMDGEKRVKCDAAWEGYWWSAPLPALPAAPVWPSMR